MHDQPEPSEFRLAPELDALQRKLALLAPTPPRIDRDQLMFQAGRAAQRAAIASRVVPDPDSATARAHFWPAATVMMTAATILLSAMLLWREPPKSATQVTATPQTNAVAQSVTVSPDRINSSQRSIQSATGYLGIRNVALTRGVGVLTGEFDENSRFSPSPKEPATARELLDELLPNAARQRS